MKLTIQPVTQKKVWEDFTSRYAPNSLFQTWSWGEVVLKTNNNLERLGLYEDDKVIGLAQIIRVNAKRGVFFHIRHGPIFSCWKKEYLQFLVDSLKRRAVKDTVWFVRMSPQIPSSKDQNDLFRSVKAIDSPIHAMDGEYAWVLKIDKTEDELLGNMRKTTRYLIRKARKVGVIVEKSQDIKSFLKLYESTSQRQGFIGHQGLEEEYRVFSEENNISLYLAKYENKIIAGALILFIGDQAIYHHGASISNEIPGSYAIQWEAIKEAKRRGKTLYNFWGIAPENKKNHPWGGLTLFKTGFGGEVRQFIHAQDIPFSPLYHITHTIETLRRVQRGY